MAVFIKNKTAFPYFLKDKGNIRTFWPPASVSGASAGQVWCPSLHVVSLKPQWLLGPDISILTQSAIPACLVLLHTCSLAKIAHIAKCLALFSYCACVCVSLTQTHSQAHTHPQAHTHLPRVDLPVNAAVQPRCLTDPFISCGGRNEPILPVWTDLTERDYLNACMDFLPCLLLPIRPPRKW